MAVATVPTVTAISPEQAISRQQKVAFLLHKIDTMLSQQVNAIIHHSRFQQLEASWRALHDLVHYAHKDSDDTIVKAMSISWTELTTDLEKAAEYDCSHFYRTVYTEEYGTPGGKPFGIIIGDYTVRNRSQDLQALRNISRVCAAAFVPFLTSPAPDMIGLEAFTDLDQIADLSQHLKHQNKQTQARVQSIRRYDDSVFLGMVLPQVLVRKPYKPHCIHRNDGFGFREDITTTDNLLWGNAAYTFATVVMRAFKRTGWFADMRGVQTAQTEGGLVDAYAGVAFADVDNDGFAQQPSINIRLTEEQEQALSENGFIPLMALPYSTKMIFNANQSFKQPDTFDDPAATRNAHITSMIQYVLCVSRFAHHLKIMMRNKIGGFTQKEALNHDLNVWLRQYCNQSDNIELLHKRPLKTASVKVFDVAGSPGEYECDIHLQPHFQLDNIKTKFLLRVNDTGAAAA